MSLQWFGAEKSLVKVDHVLGGVHPNRNSAMVRWWNLNKAAEAAIPDPTDSVVQKKHPQQATNFSLLYKKRCVICVCVCVVYGSLV